jgi:predicted  nucleic acid-binding Zn-ribbon protein
MSFSFDTFAALMALIGAAASAAVCRWRIADLERRVSQLESSERNHSDRVVKIETRLENITDLLERIALKLDVR